MKNTITFKLDPRDPELSKIREVVRGAREGKISAFPTESSYSLGLPASLPSILNVFDSIKGGQGHQDYAFYIGSLEMLDLLKIKKTPALRYLVRHFWPGPLTLLASTEKGEKIALRYPKNRLAVAIINAAGEPFLGVSAQMQGQTFPATAQDVNKQLNGKIDFIVDGGKTEYAQEPSLVDVTGAEISLVRKSAEGDAVEKAVQKIAAGKFPRKRILFVCTGNSCRSPMAEVWLKDELRRHRLSEQIEVSSTGIAAREGAKSTPEAILVMKNREIDLTQHRARVCTRMDIEDADLVFAMSHEHYVFITGLYPSAKDKVTVLNIPDPIGMGMLIYEEVIKNIEKKIKEYWKEIVS